MRALKQSSLSYRTQALITLAIVALWHWDLWVCRRAGEVAPTIAQVLFFALPLLTAVLSYIALDTRMRDQQQNSVWFYIALLSGLVPWISICI